MNKNDKYELKYKLVNFINGIDIENLKKKKIVIIKGCMGKFLKLFLWFLFFEIWGKVNKVVCLWIRGITMRKFCLFDKWNGIVFGY